MKTGWKTTEFWATVFSAGIAVWFGVQGFIPAETVITIVAIAATVWTVARTVVKLTKTKVDDEFLANLEEIFEKKKK